MSEIPLTGGTLSAVVRVGETVHRPAGPWTPTVHALLRHVRARGFELAPEPLGIDDKGREVLGFVPGVTVGWDLPWPEVIRSEDLLAQVGVALRRYHDAVADFRPEGVVPWQSGPSALGPAEIVCHHDLAPYNVVLGGDRLRCIIDWDLAGPGTARSDLAFVAWQWVPLHGPAVTQMFGWRSEPDRARRLLLLLDAYGLEETQHFVAEVMTRIRYNRDLMVRRAAEGNAGYQRLIDQGHVAGMEEALAFLGRCGTTLQERLNRDH